MHGPRQGPTRLGSREDYMTVMKAWPAMAPKAIAATSHPGPEQLMPSWASQGNHHSRPFKDSHVAMHLLMWHLNWKGVAS